MDCSCEIDSYDMHDDTTSYVVTKRQARKSHKCCECGRDITCGEIYERYVIFYDGSFSAFKTCPDCLSIRDVLFCSWSFGDIWQELQEQITNGIRLSETCIAILTKPARDRVCDMIEESWDE